MMNQKTKKKPIRKAVAVFGVVLLLLLLAVDFGGSMYLTNYAIGRSGDGGNRQVALKVDDTAVSQTDAARAENASEQEVMTQNFVEKVVEQEISIVSNDGIRLRGGYYEQENTHLWALVIHGYRGNHYGMLNYAQRYYDAGYQVLAPDLRACGNSDGDFVGMGWPDRLDMLCWIDWILERDADAKIVLHGVSMGAATTMMTSGENVPDNVIAYVEDCGYTSVWDIFSSELKLRFHLPTFPILNTASLLAKLQAGYSFTEASALDQVHKCEKPMLFIHGDQDDFVPFSMLQTLYDAKPGDNKQMLVVPGAGHGKAAEVLGEEYWDTVFAFIENYVK